MNDSYHVYVIRVGELSYWVRERSVMEAYQQFRSITGFKVSVQPHQITMKDAPEGHAFAVF